MRTQSAAIWIAALALAMLTPAGTVHAEIANKPAERKTVGAIATPDQRPADPHPTRLRPVASIKPALQTLPAAPKPPEHGTALPADPSSLTAAQREKLAAVAAIPAVATEFTSTKPADRSTIRPPAPGARAQSVGASTRRMPPGSAAASTAPHGRSLTAALGAIPRPEWSEQTAPAKPRDVSTIEPARTGARPQSPPSLFELQRRAGAAAKAAGPKPSQVTTSSPRDPSLPPATATKPTSTDQTQEVKP